MSIISISDIGVLSVAYDSVVPLPNESYVLASPDTTKWDVVASGTTGLITAVSGSAGVVTRAVFQSPLGLVWELTITNGGVLVLVPFTASLMFSPIGNDQFKSASGALAAGYLLFTYLAGTVTHATTYKQGTVLQVQPNPVVLNSLGFPTDPISIEIGKFYKFVLAPPGSPDPPVSPLYTWNDINGGALIDRTTPTEFLSKLYPATLVSLTSFSVLGDQRTTFSVGRRVKCTDATILYGTVQSLVYNSTITIVTLLLDSGALSGALTQVQVGMIQPGKSVLPDRVVGATRTSFNGNVTITSPHTFNLIPPGLILEDSVSILPTGWLWCDGTSYVRADYAALFAAIGTLFGAADGTHFNVPDLRGRMSLGKDDMGAGVAAGRVTSASFGGVNAKTLGGVGGQETHILSAAELPSHKHNLTYGTIAGTGFFGLLNPDNGAVAVTGAPIANTGTDQPHNNMPPWDACFYIICAQ